MSFSSDLKSELCSSKNSNVCCMSAELYGILLFGNTFASNQIRFYTENKTVAAYVRKLLHHLFNIDIEFESALNIKERFLLNRIFNLTNHTFNGLSLRMTPVFEDENCHISFLRGVFLSCGFITDPNKDYHLEFVTPHAALAEDLKSFLFENGLDAKITTRKSNNILYFKGSSIIEDFLLLLGAQRAFYELADIKIVKELRNNSNRVTNCDSHNLQRTAEASARQIESILFLGKMNLIKELPPELQQTAELRLKNPEASLSELGELHSPVLSRSGVIHRLNKIIKEKNNLKII